MSAAIAGDINTSPNLPNPMPDLRTQTWHLDMIHASAAYARGFTGAGVVVTVADTGFDLNSAALRGKSLTDLNRNYILSVPGTALDPTNLLPVSRKESHGTHVAGIIAGRIFDNVAAHGVAYDASIVALRVLTSDDTTTTPSPSFPIAPNFGLQYFTSLSNSMIYNASYGPGIDKDAPPQLVWQLRNYAYDHEPLDALHALQAGKIIVAANGNDRQFNPAGWNPSGLALLPFVNPAHAHLGVYDDLGQNVDFTDLQHQPGQIVAVMSVGESKQPAYYSNLCGYTASWCVAAPGGDESNRGLGVYSSLPFDTYGAQQGTSMAAPVVSGVLAVLAQANPTFDAQDLSHLLFSTTEDLGRPGLDVVYGQGLVRLDRATNGPTALAAGATETVAAGETTYWSRGLVTSGGFAKDGDGILTIAGRTDAAGDVRAARGTLAVDGTLSMTTGGLLTIAPPATLAGFGTVNGDTLVAGTLSPGKMANIGDLVANGSVPAGTVLSGNSAGTLSFNGNVTLAPSATTRLDIDGTLIVPGGPGTYDRIIVSGAGNVFWAGGTLTPVLRGSVGTVSNYTPAIGTNLQVVEARSGAVAAGSFDHVLQPDGLAADSRFDVIYASSFIRLAVTPASFASLAAHDALGSNARAIAGVLDSRRAEPGVLITGDARPLFDALYSLDSAARYDHALGQLAGPGQPAAMSAAVQVYQGFMGPIADRQNSYVLNGSAGMVGTAQSFAMSYDGGRQINAGVNQAFASLDPAPGEPGWTVWGQGFGRWSSVGASADLAGASSTSGGFVVGADRLIAADLLAGMAFGFARTTTTAADLSATSDSYAGAGYATWTPGAAKFDLRVAAGPSQISTARQTILSPGTIGGSANGIGSAVNLEAGYLIPLWDSAVLQPFAGLAWQGFQRDAYRETQPPFGLAYGAQVYDKLTTTLGLSASARLRLADGATLLPELRLGWGHDLRDITLVSQAALLDTPLIVQAASPGRDAGLVGVKLSGWRSDNVRLFGSYSGEFRGNATSHQMTAGARFSW